MKILGGNKIAIGMILVAAGISAINTYTIHNRNTKIKNEIETKNTKLYDSLKQYSAADLNNIVNWEAEQQKMNDAMKLDSLVKKAYFEGAQMVRDSIKNVNEENNGEKQ